MSLRSAIRPSRVARMTIMATQRTGIDMACGRSTSRAAPAPSAAMAASQVHSRNRIRQKSPVRDFGAGCGASGRGALGGAAGGWRAGR